MAASDRKVTGSNRSKDRPNYRPLISQPSRDSLSDLFSDSSKTLSGQEFTARIDTEDLKSLAR